MIYCVIPKALEDELFEKLSAHYSDDPNVEVIVDRRGGPDRRQGGEYGGKRTVRDRRRARARGSFPAIDPPQS